MAKLSSHCFIADAPIEIAVIEITSDSYHKHLFIDRQDDFKEAYEACI